MYDVAIIGTGPAAVSAALNLKIHNKSIICFGPSQLSQKVETSESIANYPGIPTITGHELNNLFLKQIKEMEVEIQDKMVTTIMKNGDGYMVLAGNDVYEAKTILLAVGASNSKLFDGEKELLGRGVSYCATCDGHLYKGKTVAVLCNDKRFEHEVEFIAQLAEKVYLLPIYKNCEIELDNVVKCKGSVKTIVGESLVSSVLLTDGTSIEVDGVFLLRNSVAPTTMLNQLEVQEGHIVVDRKMETNFQGCFAAGDCTGRPYQIAKAVGEGNVAAHSIVEYLAEIDKSQ